MIHSPPYHDFSYLATLSECAARFYYRYELGYTTERGPWLAAGTAGHAGLDYYYYNGRQIDGAIEAMHRAWPITTHTPSTDSHLAPDFMETVLRTYDELYKDEPWRAVTLDPARKTVAVLAGFDRTDAEGRVILGESPLVVNFAGIALGGIPDLPMQHDDGTLAVWDTKFTQAKLSPWLFERWKMSYQGKIYLSMLRRATGLDFQRFYVNAVYMGTTHEPGTRVLVDIVESWSDEIERDVLVWAIARGAEIDWRRQTGYWPQADGGYMRQKICKGCDYRAVCASLPRRRLKPDSPHTVRYDTGAGWTTYTREPVGEGLLASGADR